LLPDGGGAVLAVAGSGGRSTLLRRLCAHYRESKRRVLWTQTVAQPAPVDHLPTELEAAERIDAALATEGVAFVAGALRGRLHEGLSPRRIEALRQRHRPDIVLVDAHARCGKPLRRDAIPPIWPETTHLAFLVAPLACVGRLYGPDTVAGVMHNAVSPDGTPRRIRTADIEQSFVDPSHGLMSHLPTGALPVPFLTGFGAFRDMDGMFSLVLKLWSAPGVRAVCLAELLGDERRDAADLRDLPAGGEALQGERIYAVYPASLDN
jgi:hypothetical protein